MKNMTDEETIQLALRIAISEEEKMLEILKDTECEFTKTDIRSNIEAFRRLQKWIIAHNSYLVPHTGRF